MYKNKSNDKGSQLNLKKNVTSSSNVLYTVVLLLVPSNYFEL